MHDLAYHWPPETVAEVKWIISHCLSPERFAQGMPIANPDARRIQELAGLGYLFLSLIVERDHPFFARLAGTLRQGPKQPKKTRDIKKWAILLFCEINNCGTRAHPCDPLKLLAFLAEKGTITELGLHYSVDRKNQIPRGLRADCKAAKVTLAALPRGPRKKPEQ